MLPIKLRNKYKKEYAICAQRGWDLDALDAIISTLQIPEKLPAQHRPHKLSGTYVGWEECHIAPDWLLIYRYADGCLELYRTGTHADLFGK